MNRGFSILLILILSGCAAPIPRNGSAIAGAACRDASGRLRPVGSSWTCPDGCNTCTCTEDATGARVVSTLKICK